MGSENLAIELLIKARDDSAAAFAQSSAALDKYLAQLRNLNKVPPIKPTFDSSAIQAATRATQDFLARLSQISPQAAGAVIPIQGMASSLEALAGAGSLGAIAIGGVAAGSAAVVAVSLAAAHSFSEQVTQLKRVSSQAGVTINQMQDLQEATKRLGASGDAAGTALYYLNAAIERGDPNLRALGADGLNVHDALFKVVEALGQMDSKSRTAYGAALLGSRSFKELSGIIDRLAGEYRLVGIQAEQSGKHISEAEEEAAGRFNAAAESIQARVDGLITRFKVLATTAVALPIVETAATALDVGNKPGVLAPGLFAGILSNAQRGGLLAGSVYGKGFADAATEAAASGFKPPQVGSVEANAKAAEIASAIATAAASDRPSTAVRKLATEYLRLAAAGGDAKQAILDAGLAASKSGLTADQIEAASKVFDQMKKSAADAAEQAKRLADLKRLISAGASAGDIFKVSFDPGTKEELKRLRDEGVQVILHGGSREEVQAFLKVNLPTEQEQPETRLTESGVRMQQALEAAAIAADNFAFSFRSAVGGTLADIALDTRNAGALIRSEWQAVLRTVISGIGEALGQLALNSGAGKAVTGGISSATRGILGAKEPAEQAAVSASIKAMGAAAAGTVVPLDAAGGAASSTVGPFAAAGAAASALAAKLAAAAGIDLLGPLASLPFFADGGLVPRTGPAIIHAGEGVLNAAAMARPGVRDMLGGLNSGGDLAALVSLSAGSASGASGAASVAVLRPNGGGDGFGASRVSEALLSEIRGLRGDVSGMRHELGEIAQAKSNLTVNALGPGHITDSMQPGGAMYLSYRRLSEVRKAS